MVITAVAKKNNLIQSWEYGEAKCESENTQPIRLLIFNEKKSIIGIAQVIFKRIPFGGFVCRMNRGPFLLGDDYKNVEVKIKIILCIINYLKNTNCLIFLCNPEIEWSNSSNKLMKYMGGISISIKPKWGSGKINLEDNEEKLLNQLKAKWRNSLNKGLKSELITYKDKLTNESLETL